MERVEVYLTNFGKLRIDAFFDKKNEYSNYRWEGIKAENYIDELSRQSIRYAQEDGENLIVTYNGLKLIINEFEDVMYIKKYRDLFMPIILKIKHQEERRRVKELKNKKVQRKNKHIKSRIIASGLTIITLSGIMLGMTKKNEKNKNTGIIPTSYAQTLSDEEITEEDIYDTIPSETKNDNVVKVSISYGDRTGTEKAAIAQNNYKALIDKYSKMYGLDSKLMLALATQERGIHSEKKDSGGGIGLMQIQNNVWANQALKVYNFETKKYETIIVNPKNLSNLEYNIKIGCMIFEQNLEYMNYNPLLALQSYNMGYGNMQKIINNCCADTKKSKSEVLNDYYNIDWMNYRNLIQVGDQKYVEHVLSYCGDNINIENIRPDGTKSNININNKKTEKYIK